MVEDLETKVKTIMDEAYKEILEQVPLHYLVLIEKEISADLPGDYRENLSFEYQYDYIKKREYEELVADILKNHLKKFLK